MRTIVDFAPLLLLLYSLHAIKQILQSCRQRYYTLNNCVVVDINFRCNIIYLLIGTKFRDDGNLGIIGIY